VLDRGQVLILIKHLLHQPVYLRVQFLSLTLERLDLALERVIPLRLYLIESVLLVRHLSLKCVAYLLLHHHFVVDLSHVVLLLLV
jgi:hypothetical protein